MEVTILSNYLEIKILCCRHMFYMNNLHDNFLSDVAVMGNVLPVSVFHEWMVIVAKDIHCK